MSKKLIRLILIALMVISMFALLGNETMAAVKADGAALVSCSWFQKYVLKAANCKGGCYTLKLFFKGGAKPDSTFYGSELLLDDVAVACLGPGSKKQDVRVGVAGIEPIKDSFYVYDLPIDENGRFVKTVWLPSVPGDFCPEDPYNEDDHYCTDNPEYSLCACCSDPACTEGLPLLLDFYQGLSDDVCKDNWSVYEVMIRRLVIDGMLYTTCEYDVDPSCDTCQKCSPGAYHCMTNANPRAWPGIVEYNCNLLGGPIAFDDAYTARKNKTLTIGAPGVLVNDYDAEYDPLTAFQPLDDEGNVKYPPAHGAVTLNGDGSFTYTPDDGWKGGDSFVYQANDGVVGASNEATVTITVK